MKRILFILIIISASCRLFAFPENHEARTRMRELITAPTSDVLSVGEQLIEQLTDGSIVSFKVRVQNDSFYQLFINESNGRYPIYSKGTYIIKRNLEDGKFIQIKVFLKNHTECYVRLYPLDDRAMMELVLYGKTIYSDVNLPFSFADVLVEPFSEIIDASAGIIDWDLIFPDTASYLYEDKNKLSKEIRANLSLINDVDDGAMDYDGTFVYIDDLSPQLKNSQGFNCSGFVKWVGDGLYWSETGDYMSISDLKSKHLEQRGNRWSARHEDDRDPYFGLDWTRNIAVSIAEEQRKTELDYKSADVRDVPWATYTEDIGFPIEELKLIMYYLAVNEPQNIFLASVNESWGKEPILQQHIHTAVLVPLIDSAGGFKDQIFERNFESSADLLAERYPDAHVHLTRIKTGAGFNFPDLISQPSLGSGSYFRR
ncbi:MAG TPA: hypothetical protein DCO79_02050 [Spirochaeta sp.]|nr:hypothetical protein [Spirochaeta sp.]